MLLAICSPWYEYVNSIGRLSCLEFALLENGWAIQADLDGLSEIDKQSLLSVALNQVLDPEEHSLQELQSRDVESSSGGLCGMAAIYQSLQETLLTKTQLQKMSIYSMRERIYSELKLDPKKGRKEGDANLLKMFHQRICHHVTETDNSGFSPARRRRDISFLVSKIVFFFNNSNF